MHFEVPKAKTLKEFGGEYLMIVISILTALALEHGVQTMHHHTVAHEASEKIDAEIRENIKEITLARDHNAVEMHKLQLIRDALLVDLKAKVDEDVLRKRLLKEYAGAFSLSMRAPSLRREAWEVAVANQAVSWMPAETLKRYSAIYATMRDVQSYTGGASRAFLNGPQMLDTMSNATMGVVDPRDAFRMLNQIISSYSGINGNLNELRILMDEQKQAPKGAH
jgi:hypothetical protein